MAYKKSQQREVDGEWLEESANLPQWLSDIPEDKLV
jgi:hypothetical protein